jgi:Na+/H+-translocating membrane pyrophosphatase
MYGVTLAAVGMLSTAISHLANYSYGPIVDNAKTILKICENEEA